MATPTVAPSDEPRCESLARWRIELSRRALLEHFTAAAVLLATVSVATLGRARGPAPMPGVKPEAWDDGTFWDDGRGWVE
jgi:hypothetical protein